MKPRFGNGGSPSGMHHPAGSGEPMPGRDEEGKKFAEPQEIWLITALSASLGTASDTL